jgi:hypothetical protein
MDRRGGLQRAGDASVALLQAVWVPRDVDVVGRSFLRIDGPPFRVLQTPFFSCDRPSFWRLGPPFARDPRREGPEPGLSPCSMNN